jgi:hypothetical protein
MNFNEELPAFTTSTFTAETPVAPDIGKTRPCHTPTGWAKQRRAPYDDMLQRTL